MRKASINAAPNRPGVYVLWNEQVPLHVGLTPPQGKGIRDLLHEHLEDPSCTATHFSYRDTNEPQRLHSETIVAIHNLGLKDQD